MTSAVTSSSSNDHAVSEGLGLWEPKRTLTLDAARRHSARIRLFRKLLVLTAVGLTGVVVWQFINQPAGFDLVDNPEETVRMVNPKYSGRTSDGLPYYLTAADAVRNASTSTAVNLSAPVLNFYRAPGAEPSKVTALEGIYDDVDNILNLSDTVNLGTDDGYACDTSEAKIFTKDKRISGNAPIACTGSFGAVKGNSYTITDDYTAYTFADGMNATITRDAASSSDDNFGFEGNSPIDLSAQTATYKDTTTTLSGDVDVKQGGSRVTSNEMIIYRAKAKKNETDGPSKSLKLGAITQIDAKGRFVYTTPERRLTGNRGVYDRAKNIITVTGNVELKQSDGTVVTGEKLVYDMDKKSAKVGETCTGENCDRFTFEIKRD
jgi:lipopolysaccharide transport protein LptA